MDEQQTIEAEPEPITLDLLKAALHKLEKNATVLR